MAGSSVLIPIVVAVIGVVGTVVPAIYVNSLQTRPNAEVTLSGRANYYTNFSGFSIMIANEGNAPATNLTLIFSDVASARHASIFYVYGTTDVQYGSNILEPGSLQTITTPSSGPLELFIPKLIHGSGSFVALALNIDAGYAVNPLRVNAVYDQGSNELLVYQGEDLYTSKPSLNFTRTEEQFREQAQTYLSTLFSPGLVLYYIVFFTAIGSLMYLHIRRSRTMRRFLSKVVKNFVEIRGILRDDPSNKEIFSEVWFEMAEKKRQDNHHIGDYLLIDDFYSILKRRNQLLSKGKGKEESDHERAITLAKLNEALLAAAENVLNKIDWNKYR